MPNHICACLYTELMAGSNNETPSWSYELGSIHVMATNISPYGNREGNNSTGSLPAISFSVPTVLERHIVRTCNLPRGNFLSGNVDFVLGDPANKIASLAFNR